MIHRPDFYGTAWGERLASAHVAAVISGDSHRSVLDWREGMLYPNPASAGLRRLDLPVTVVLIRLNDRELAAEIVDLAV